MDARISVELRRSEALFGDIFFPRAGNRKAAANWYRKSLQNYEWAHDWVSAKRVEEKLNRLLGAETAVSRYFDRLALFIQRQAIRMRAPPQT